MCLTKGLSVWQIKWKLQEWTSTAILASCRCIRCFCTQRKEYISKRDKWKTERGLRCACSCEVSGRDWTVNVKLKVPQKHGAPLALCCVQHEVASAAAGLASFDIRYQKCWLTSATREGRKPFSHLPINYSHPRDNKRTHDKTVQSQL